MSKLVVTITVTRADETVLQLVHLADVASSYEVPTEGILLEDGRAWYGYTFQTARQSQERPMTDWHRNHEARDDDDPSDDDPRAAGCGAVKSARGVELDVVVAWAVFVVAVLSVSGELVLWAFEGVSPSWWRMLVYGWALGETVTAGAYRYGGRVSRWVLWRVVCHRGRDCGELIVDGMMVPPEMRSRVTFEIGYECARCGTSYVVTAMPTGEDTWVVTDRRRVAVPVLPSVHVVGVEDDCGDDVVG